jgi:hypothetical protein
MGFLRLKGNDGAETMTEVMNQTLRSLNGFRENALAFDAPKTMVAVGVCSLFAALVTSIASASLLLTLIPLAFGAGVVVTIFLLQRSRARERYLSDELGEDEGVFFGVDWRYFHRGARPIPPFVPSCPICRGELEIVEGKNVAHKAVLAPEAVLRCASPRCTFQRGTGVPRMTFSQELREQIGTRLRQLRLDWQS